MLTSAAHRLPVFGLAACLLISLAACDATRELVKAPFDATTAVSDGTTQASSEFTQPSKEFTSSTTPGSRVGSERLIRAKQRVHTFIAYNFGNVQHEIAQGRGEYLSSLATLAEIPTNRQPEFFRTLQTQYVELFLADQKAADVIRLVDIVWLAPVGAHTAQ
ncbi:MAG TPA: DUF3015 family protein [Nitrospira sp.]|nr:DUF3015 family protein [Nitrospira sp.]